jgi:GR25 family glycosyltransferase involved in LPS biosynthesis
MTNFLSGVPIFYINLDKDVDRKKYIENHFKKNNIHKYFRVSAIDGNDINNVANLSNSEFGCTLSHLSALQSFLKTDFDFAMICEDDIDLSNIKKIGFNFYDTLSMHNPTDYCLQLAVLTREENDINFNIHERGFYDFSTAGYIVNREYATKLIKQYGDDNTFYYFNKRVVVDPRGGEIVSRPVADELVYNSCKTMSLPIFTLNDISPTINTTSENIKQLKTSILKHTKYWEKFKTINIKIFMVQ